jgi:hypothetical protein
MIELARRPAAQRGPILYVLQPPKNTPGTECYVFQHGQPIRQFDKPTEAKCMPLIHTSLCIY